MKRLIEWVLPKYEERKIKVPALKVWVPYEGKLLRSYWDGDDLIIVSKVQTKGWFE